MYGRESVILWGNMHVVSKSDRLLYHTIGATALASIKIWPINDTGALTGCSRLAELLTLTEPSEAWPVGLSNNLLEINSVKHQTGDSTL